MANAKRKIGHDHKTDAGRRSEMAEGRIQRRYPIGAELIGEGLTHFRVWAPKAKRLDVVLESSPENEAERTFHPLEEESGGYFSGPIAAKAGAFYRFRVNEAETFHPDPASRFQPQGPHRSSCVVDPSRFRWSDQQWKGLRMPGQIIYEMHIGTFTREGTWRALCPIVGIGGSAGGFEAAMELLRHLPAKTGTALVVVQHLDPHHKSKLASLLGRATQIPVVEVEGTTVPEPNMVYVQPPNKCLIFKNDKLTLVRRTEVRNLAIDHFFESLAKERGSRPIGVVLS